ncbi:C4-dicarboxylate ABC transporter [Sporomusaceae bacterium FL31]|nr:C4-dicarboxylate ABC transporter [Sporomusaceae bacterium FL31]GCE33786.1 C4-dicarboxylate ABC transporter [Sporomusaceae bacterium]
MLGVVIASLVIVLIAYLVYKKYKPQTVILLGGIILLASAIIIGHPIIAAKQSTGNSWLDIFKVVEDLTSNRVAGLGLMIMSVSGFVKYMDVIGASKAFVHIGVKPLQFIRSPYVMVACAYLIGQLMKMAITSAAGLGVLLMATMFPILLSLGVSRGAAAAVIVSASCIDLGPAAGTSNLMAKTAGIDVVDYFINYQLVVAIPVILTIAVLHAIVQRYFDRKEGLAGAEKLETKAGELPPKIYAILPILPLLMIFAFSPVVGSKLKMSLVSAMFFGLFIAMIFEFIRTRQLKEVFSGIQKFFDGMGSAFASVVTLIIAGELFATGLGAIGAVDTVITASKNAGLGEEAMTILLQTVIAGATILTGSGDATVFSFAGLAPVIASHHGVNPVEMLIPMQFSATLARSISPISAVMIAVAGIAAISPFDIAKRTMIPLGAGLIVTTIASLLLI